MSLCIIISFIILSCLFYLEVSGCYSYPYDEWHYTHIGCFKDTWPPSLIPMLEGNENVSYILNDHYKRRRDAVNKCYLATYHLGYKYFGVQDDGMCVSSKDAVPHYSKLGESIDCKGEGKGGPLSNDIYMITSKPGTPQRMVVCNFVNITGLAMVKNSGMPRGPDIEIGRDKFIGIKWKKCESFE